MEDFEYKRVYWLKSPVWSYNSSKDIVLKLVDVDGEVTKLPMVDKEKNSQKVISSLVYVEYLTYLALTLITSLFIFAIILSKNLAFSFIFLLMASLAMFHICKLRHEERLIKYSNNTSKNFTITFAHSGLNELECSETVKLLNKLISENNENEYEKIVKNLLKEEETYYEGKLEHEKILNDLNNKKISNRIVTGDIHQSNKLSEYNSIFNNSIINTNGIKKDFMEVSEKLETLQAGRGEIKIFKDAYKELFNNTKEYEKIVEGGGVISRSEWESFYDLIKTCESIIKATEVREIEGGLADSARISSMFLKDKYNIGEEVNKDFS